MNGEDGRCVNGEDGRCVNKSRKLMDVIRKTGKMSLGLGIRCEGSLTLGTEGRPPGDRNELGYCHNSTGKAFSHTAITAQKLYKSTTA